MTTKHLPNTPAEARSVPLASLGVGAFKEAITTARNGGASEKAVISLAKLIATHGRKYTPEARQFAAGFASGSVEVS